MTKKDQFSSDEWRTLLETPLLAGALVMLVSPQGPVGVLKEINTLSSSAEAMLGHGAAHELIDALREDLRQQQAAGQVNVGVDRSLDQFRSAEFHSLEQAQKLVLDRCREVTQLLHLKALDEEGSYYRRGILWICWQVASAAREEGGLFGINSVQITENEQQAIRKIGFALGISNQEIMQGGQAGAKLSGGAPAGGQRDAVLPAVPVRKAPHAALERFTFEEWDVLRQTPVWVGAAVSAAAPSGVWGTIQELNALVQATQETIERFGEQRLISDLMDDMSLLSSQAEPAVQMPNKLTSAAARQRAVELCRKAAGILEQKASLQEASAYKQMLALIAQKVAQGAREGGVLGIGAQQVSPSEQTLLQELSDALGFPI